MLQQRPALSVEPDDSVFVHPTMDYSHQFDRIYFSRFTALRPLVAEAVQAKHPTVPLIDAINLLKQTTDNVALVGNVFKRSPKVPTLLSEYLLSKNVHSVAFSAPTYVSADDTFTLEDLTSTIELAIPAPAAQQLVSGITVAVVGKVNESQDVFLVHDIVFVNTEPEPVAMPESTPRRHIALVSDIAYVPDLQTGLLFNILTNAMSFPTIGYAVLIGPHCAASDTIPAYDQFLHAVGETLPFAIVPAAADPTNAVYPFQPFHFAIFPKANSRSSCHNVSNPCVLRVEELRCFVFSGDIVAHMQKFMAAQSCIDVVKKMLVWGHIAPCSPATFPCFPSEQDPFVLGHVAPDIVVVSGFDEGCATFRHCGKLVTIVTVPSFRTHHKVALFDPDGRSLSFVELVLE